jgi:hypothetical protein
MTLSNFSCLIGAETFSLFDDALPLPTIIDIIGGRRIQIIKIQAFHKPISKAGVIDIFFLLLSLSYFAPKRAFHLTRLYPTLLDILSIWAFQYQIQWAFYFFCSNYNYFSNAVKKAPVGEGRTYPEPCAEYHFSIVSGGEGVINIFTLTLILSHQGRGNLIKFIIFLPTKSGATTF